MYVHTHTASSVVTDNGHTHIERAPNVNNVGAGSGGGFANSGAGDAASGSAQTGISVATTINGSGGAETRPKNIGLHMIAKAF